MELLISNTKKISNEVALLEMILKNKLSFLFNGRYEFEIGKFRCDPMSFYENSTIITSTFDKIQRQNDGTSIFCNITQQMALYFINR